MVFVFVYCGIKHQLLFSCHNQADGTNGCLCAAADIVAAPAEAMKGLLPVDKPRCDSIHGLLGAVKAEVLMDIQPQGSTAGTYILLPSCTFLTILKQRWVDSF